MKYFTLFVVVYTVLVHISLGEYPLPKFVCTPMPLDMDCQPNMQRHSPGSGGHWAGMQEEAKETILHLRETVVHQKETILDQRETIRELTVKLSRCEGYPHSRGHEESNGHSSEHGQEREHGHEESIVHEREHGYKREHGHEYEEGHDREHGRKREHGHEYEEGHDREHGHKREHGHEHEEGHDREHGHKREHGHEYEEGHEREHGHEWEHGHEREHVPKREHGHEWEERHERDYGHEREHGHERDHGHEREHPHGYEDTHGHIRDHEYHHLTHREYREQPEHDVYRKSSAPPNTMEDPPEVTPSGIPQMERMLESLKDRLEHLQRNRNSSLFSTSLRDALQKKISILEHQIHEKHNTSEHHDKEHQTHENPVRHKMNSTVHSNEKGHKADKKSNDFRVSFPLRTNYMYAKVKRTLHHEIFAFTICLWLKSNSSPGIGTPFSYSVPGQANEVVLIEWGNNPMELLINDKAVTLPLVINDAKWHHVGITWSTRDGLWDCYLDGVRRGSGENLAPWHPIKPGGIFILGQEQDTLGGRFDATQAFVGEITDFNMWSHILTPGEIYNLATCATHSTGDVIDWTESSMELHGGVSKLPFNSCH
ncbi:neuronal pentraxin-2-like [Mixophyes fleayi]|uniref:neuronal pentraxin-2-like n=1 Tax=Mixophyes fleayi TaxID=3061075 RepID=UPI003F4DB4E0